MAAAARAITVCEAHLAATNSFGTEIEAYLVQYLLVLICSETDETVHALVESRGRLAGDVQLAAFVKSASKRLFQRLRVGDIGGILARFDGALKDEFLARVNNTPANTAFDNIVNNRLQVAHTTQTIQMTFRELEQAHRAAAPVLTEFADLLGVPLPQ